MLMLNNRGLDDIKVVVLSGGLGTRLHARVPDVPKVLAPIGSRRFIDYLLDYISEQGVKRITFSLGYKAEMVEAYLASCDYPELFLDSVCEPEPLGTAGALRYVLKQSPRETSPFLVVNGDTFIDVDLRDFVRFCESGKAHLGLVAVKVDDCSRFGELLLEGDSMIARFKEKDNSNTGPGWINGGVYYFSALAQETLLSQHGASLENDFFPGLIQHGIGLAYQYQGSFIDIGTPESFDLVNKNKSVIGAVD